MILNVIVISNCNEEFFKDEVNDFLDFNEDMIDLNKTVYGITQESVIDIENRLITCTKYSAIFQIEGERRR